MIRKPDQIPTYYSKNIQNCIILGAGASRSTGYWENAYPLDKDFFLMDVTKKILSNPDYHLIDKLKNFFFQNLNKANSEVGMEEFFSFIDQVNQWLHLKDSNGDYLANQRSNIFFPLPYTIFSKSLDFRYTTAELKTQLVYDRDTLTTIQKDLALCLLGKDSEQKPMNFSVIRNSFSRLVWDFSRFINEVLMEASNKALKAESDINKNDNYKIHRNSGFQVSCPTFKKYLNMLCEDSLLNQTSIISFNYDLIADSTLYELVGQEHWNSEVIYMQVFEPILERREEEPVLPMLLKPHGSMNWLNFPDFKNQSWQRCFKRHERPQYATSDILKENGMVPRIFLPVQNKIAELTEKGYIAGYVRQWVISLDVLINSKNWTFIGYSLPQADFQTNMLLQIALSRRQNKPIVTIINPELEKSNINTFFKNRGVDTNLKSFLSQLI